MLFFKNESDGTITIDDKYLDGFSRLPKADDGIYFREKQVIINAKVVNKLVCVRCAVAFTNVVALMSQCRFEDCRLGYPIVTEMHETSIAHCAGSIAVSKTLQNSTLHGVGACVDGDVTSSRLSGNGGCTVEVRSKVSGSVLENAFLTGATITNTRLGGNITADAGCVYVVDPLGGESIVRVFRGITSLRGVICIDTTTPSCRYVTPMSITHFNNVGRHGRGATSLVIFRNVNNTKLCEQYVAAGCFAGTLAEFKAASAAHHDARQAKSYEIHLQAHRRALRNHYDKPVRFVKPSTLKTK